METKEVVSTKKSRTTAEKDEIFLNEVFIKRLRERRKTNKSTLLCEGVRLLYQQEIGGVNG